MRLIQRTLAPLASFFILGVIIASCNGGPTGPSTNVTLSVTVLEFSIAEDQRTVVITNLGDDPIDWRLLYSSISWLTASPAVGTVGPHTSQSFTVQINRAAVSQGAHSASLKVLTGNVTHVLDVSVEHGGAAVAAIQPSSLTLGPLDDSGIIEIASIGGSTLNWTLTSVANWATISPSSGSVPPGESGQVVVTGHRQGLTKGTYIGTLLLSSNGGTSSAQIAMEVGDAAGLHLDPAVLDFGLSTLQRPLRIVNDGYFALSWTAEPDAPWLSISPASGNVPPRSTGQVIVTVSRAGLSHGTHQTTLRFDSDGGSAAANVTLNAAPSGPTPPSSSTPAQIQISPVSLDFGDTETELEFVVHNAGSEALDWVGGTEASWVVMTPSFGRVSPHASANVTVKVLRSGLTAGSYQANVVFDSNGGSATGGVLAKITETGGTPGPDPDPDPIPDPDDTDPPPSGGPGLSGIDATGTWDVTDQLNEYLASVPNGSVVRLAAGARYRAEGVIRLIDRTNFTIEGNGALIFATTDGNGVTPPEDLKHLWPRSRAHVEIRGGSNIVIRDLLVRGANPNAGSEQGAYVVTLEGQHGFDIRGVDGLLLDRVTVTDTYGDLLYLGGLGGTWSRNIRVTNSHFERSGRQGIAITGAENVQILESYIGEVARTIIDLEPATIRQGARNISFEGNTFGFSRHLLMSSGGGGPNVDDIYFIANRLVGMALKIRVVAADGARRSNYKVLDNSSDVLLGLPVAALRFTRVDGIEVRGNYQRMNTQRSMTAVSTCESMDIIVEDNDFPGASKEFRDLPLCQDEGED